MTPAFVMARSIRSAGHSSEKTLLFPSPLCGGGLGRGDRVQVPTIRTPTLTLPRQGGGDSG